jgi:hypothetical protein
MIMRAMPSSIDLLRKAANPGQLSTMGTPASLSTPSIIAVATAIKNPNTGVSTATPGIIDHTAQVGRLSIACFLGAPAVKIQGASQQPVLALIG